jgi:ribosomal protein S18 acetylase RimI-like enzyme
MDRLDNAAWHALTGPHAGLAEVAGAARRYPPAVSFFSAVDRVDAEGWDSLTALAGPGGVATLSRATHPDPPVGWRELFCVHGHQMVLDADLAPDDRDPEVVLRPLTGEDVPAMLALTGLSKPGPFFDETVRLGGYVGVEQDGALVAMAGRRLRLPGAVEISAVCVHPDVAGRGLGTAVTSRVARDILAEGDLPFLHVAHGNDGARRVYERLGFAIRTTIAFVSYVRTDGDQVG